MAGMVTVSLQAFKADRNPESLLKKYYKMRDEQKKGNKIVQKTIPMISQTSFISPGVKLLCLYMKDLKDGVKNLMHSVYPRSSTGTAHM